MSRDFLTEPIEGPFSLACWLVVVPMLGVNLCRPACEETGLKFRHQLKGNLRELQKRCPEDAVEHWAQTAENKTCKWIISKAKSLPMGHLKGNPMWSQRTEDRKWSPLKIYPPPYTEEAFQRVGQCRKSGLWQRGITRSFLWWAICLF